MISKHSLIPSLLLLCGFALPKKISAKPLNFISAVPLGAYIRGASNSYLGNFQILNRRQFITMRPDNYKVKSTIDFWNLKSGKIESRIFPPKSECIGGGSVEVSPDGTKIIARQALFCGHDPHVRRPHQIYSWDLKTKKLLRTLDIGRDVHLDEAKFLPYQSKIILVKYRKYVDVKIGIVGEKRYTIYFDINTGKRLPHFRYAASEAVIAGYTHSSLFSPNRKYLLNTIEMGEGEPGSVTVSSLQTGKVLANHNGAFDGRATDGPAFFLSNQKVFFSSWNSVSTDEAPLNIYTNMVLNIETSQARLCSSPRLLHLHLIAGVPSHPGWAFFAARKGLELWDVTNVKLLQLWPNIKHIEQIFFAHDNSVFGLYGWRAASDDIEGAVGLDENGTGIMPGSETVQFWTLPSKIR